MGKHFAGLILDNLSSFRAVLHSVTIAHGALLLSFLVLSCSESPVTRELVLNAKPVPAASSSIQQTQPYVKHFSFANFRKDTLEYCSDVTLTIVPPPGLYAEWKPEKMYNLRESLADFGTEIKRPCNEQFSERPVLATCTAKLKNDLEHSELSIFERYYDTHAISESDRHMKECLHLGGEWNQSNRPTVKSNKPPIDDAISGLRESTVVN